MDINNKLKDEIVQEVKQLIMESLSGLVGKPYEELDEEAVSEELLGKLTDALQQANENDEEGVSEYMDTRIEYLQGNATKEEVEEKAKIFGENQIVNEEQEVEVIRSTNPPYEALAEAFIKHSGMSMEEAYQQAFKEAMKSALQKVHTNNIKAEFNVTMGNGQIEWGTIYPDKNILVIEMVNKKIPTVKACVEVVDYCRAENCSCVKELAADTEEEFKEDWKEPVVVKEEEDEVITYLYSVRLAKWGLVAENVEFEEHPSLDDEFELKGNNVKVMTVDTKKQVVTVVQVYAEKVQYTAINTASYFGMNKTVTLEKPPEHGDEIIIEGGDYEIMAIDEKRKTIRVASPFEATKERINKFEKEKSEYIEDVCSYIEDRREFLTTDDADTSPDKLKIIRFYMENTSDPSALEFLDQVNDEYLVILFQIKMEDVPLGGLTSYTEGPTNYVSDLVKMVKQLEQDLAEKEAYIISDIESKLVLIHDCIYTSSSADDIAVWYILRDQPRDMQLYWENVPTHRIANYLYNLTR